MQRLNGNAPIPEAFRGGIVALGNFDGVHAGHQAVIGRALEIARARGVPTLVATFDPHPVRHFQPDAAPFRLTTLDQRQRYLAEMGVDAMVVFSFGAELASVTADDFVTRWLGGHLGVTGVVTGEDFTFGKGRGGNISVLRALGTALGISCEAVGPVCDADGAISSSRIREALQAGDCETATRLLTRPFAVEGAVMHGDKNGRKLGFPTANIDMGSYLRPLYGIYAVRGLLHDGRRVDGAANIGIRPSFDPPKEILEPHFFDFKDDLYGKTLEIEFVHFLRPEKKFDSLDDLMEQIARDCEAARVILGICPSGD